MKMVYYAKMPGKRKKAHIKLKIEQYVGFFTLYIVI